jgi:hypothetical protein
VPTTNQYIADRFDDVSEIVLRYENNRDLLVRRTAASLLPQLAECDPIAFVRKTYLKRSMDVLMGALRKDKRDKNRALCKSIFSFYFFFASSEFATYPHAELESCTNVHLLSLQIFSA